MINLFYAECLRCDAYTRADRLEENAMGAQGKGETIADLIKTLRQGGDDIGKE